MPKTGCKTSIRLAVTLLCVTALLAFCCVSVLAGEIYVEGAYQYSIENDSITIVGYFGKDSEVTVPSAIGVYPVSTIAKGAFAKNTYVKTIWLPDTIMTVEEGAFSSAQTARFLRDISATTASEPVYSTVTESTTRETPAIVTETTGPTETTTWYTETTVPPYTTTQSESSAETHITQTTEPSRTETSAETTMATETTGTASDTEGATTFESTSDVISSTMTEQGATLTSSGTDTSGGKDEPSPIGTAAIIILSVLLGLAFGVFLMIMKNKKQR